jgi:hypothetical protein
MVVNIIVPPVTSEKIPYFYTTLCKCPQMVTAALSITFSYWRYSGISSFKQTIWREFHTHIIVSNIKFCFSPDKFNSTEMTVVRRKYKGHEPVYIQNVISPLCLFFDVADILARWHHRRLPPSLWNHKINSVFPAWSLEVCRTARSGTTLNRKKYNQLVRTRQNCTTKLLIEIHQLLVTHMMTSLPPTQTLQRSQLFSWVDYNIDILVLYFLSETEQLNVSVTVIQELPAYCVACSLRYPP